MHITTSFTGQMVVVAGDGGRPCTDAEGHIYYASGEVMSIPYPVCYEIRCVDGEVHGRG